MKVRSNAGSGGYIPKRKEATMNISDDMVSRFLTWPVPADVCPDGTPGQPGRTGTNLLTAEQARAMLEHVLGTGESPMTREFCAAFPGSAAGMINVLATRIDARDAEIKRLRTALRFYANGDHYRADEGEEFDTCSGEPQNWIFSGIEDSSTSIETGGVAKAALQGIDVDWSDGGEDTTPRPVPGEVSCVE